MSDRALLIVSRVASSDAGDGLADLSPENRKRAGKVNEDPAKGYPSELWLAERAKIMERVTIPALALVSASFTWVWRVCAERFEQAAELRDRLFPTAVVLDDRCMTSDEVAPDSERFLTVRLDSDDALLPAALDEVAALDLAPRTLVNWWRGWQWDLNTGEVGAKEWRLRTQGPFLAVTHESREEMLQAGIPHSYAREGRKVVSVDGRNWVQTLHDRNQLTRWQAGQELLSASRAARVLAPFGLAP